MPPLTPEGFSSTSFKCIVKQQVYPVAKENPRTVIHKRHTSLRSSTLYVLYLYDVGLEIFSQTSKKSEKSLRMSSVTTVYKSVFCKEWSRSARRCRCCLVAFSVIKIACTPIMNEVRDV